MQNESKKLIESQQEWVNALRSGEYMQGRQVLHNLVDDTWCCLGVACDLFNKKFPGELKITKVLTVTTFDGSFDVLPTKVKNWLGLATVNGEYETSYLTRLNDVKGYTFDQIADVIESKPEELFKE